MYTISYDLDGGISPGNPASYTVESNDIRLSRPTRMGYDFLGWSFEGIISLDVTIPHGSIGSREFKALWVAHKYEISYNLNGATAEGNPSSYTIETPAFTLNSPTKTGYTFTGWVGTSLDSPATAVTIPQGSSGNRSYTARFTPITYSIAYDLDGGTLPHGSPESYDIESQTFTLNIPTKRGFVFIGWTGSGLDEPEITITIPQGSTGNRSYTAHYAEAQEDYPPEITADSFTLNAHKGQPATLLISASSREIPNWTLSGDLPEGLTFTASDYSAEISGIPGAGTSGRYALNITASNSAGASSADILILIAGYSALSLDTHTTHTAFRDNSGNLILSADIAIIADSYDLTVEHGTLITIIASVDTALELYDSDYDTYIYSLDMAGLPHWLNVSGDVASHDVITLGVSYHHHEFTLTGIPESSHDIADITLTAIVNVSGDIPVLVAQSSRDIHICVRTGSDSQPEIPGTSDDITPEIPDTSDDVTPEIPGESSDITLQSLTITIAGDNSITVEAGESASITITTIITGTFTDGTAKTLAPNDYVLTWQAENLPGGMSFIGGTLSVTESAEPGTYHLPIIVRASSNGITATAKSSLTANVKNIKPALHVSESQITAHKGHPFTATITAVEGTNIEWSCSGLTEWMSFTHSGDSAKISGTPLAAMSGTYSAVITASNDAGVSSLTINITVKGWANDSINAEKSGVFRDISGNLILSADVDIITSTDSFTAICCESFNIPVIVEAHIILNDSDYDTYIYSIDVAGLPEWLNVSGDISFTGVIDEGESTCNHEFMLYGMPSLPGEYHATITAHVKISGDVPELEASADRDMAISVQAKAPVLRSLDVSITGGESLTLKAGESGSVFLTASVNGIFSDGTTRLFTPDEYSLTWQASYLPGGISFSDGVLTASNDTQPGDYTITIEAEAYSVGITGSASKVIAVNVSNVPPILNASSNELTLTVGSSISPIIITALEGTNITWTHEGSLPEGLSLTHDSHAMTIYGTVSGNAETGQYIFTAKAANDSGHDEATITFNVMRQSVITAGNVELSLSDFAAMTENELAGILGGSETVTVEGFAEDIGEAIAKIDRSTNVKHVNLSRAEGVNEIELDSLSSIEIINLSGNKSATRITITSSNSLITIDLSGSNLVNVNLQGCPNLESVNVLNCEHLETLNASSCGLEEVEIGGCENLREIDIRFNRLRRFDASELGNLMSLYDEGQSVNVDEIGARMNMLAFIEGTMSASGIIEASGAENVKNLKAYDIFGNEIHSSYDPATGEAVFDSAPAVVTYDYATGFGNDVMDVTISAIERGNESVSVQSESSGGGGGCMNVNMIACVVVVIALLFVKGGCKN